MKRYSVFDLYVVKKDNHKFICEKILENEYREVLTKEKLIIEENETVESLTKYYSILAIATYKNGQVLNPLMLSKKDILLKYIEINEKVRNKEVNINDFLKKQQEELEGLKVLASECPELAKQLASETLQGLGIIDEEENLIGPYKDILKKERTVEKVTEMYKTYIEIKKEDIPDIPMESAKELRKQKPFDKN